MVEADVCLKDLCMGEQSFEITYNTVCPSVVCLNTIQTLQGFTTSY
jgi:hypothetical protein